MSMFIQHLSRSGKINNLALQTSTRPQRASLELFLQDVEKSISKDCCRSMHMKRRAFEKWTRSDVAWKTGVYRMKYRSLTFVWFKGIYNCFVSLLWRVMRTQLISCLRQANPQTSVFHQERKGVYPVHWGSKLRCLHVHLKASTFRCLAVSHLMKTRFLLEFKDLKSNDKIITLGPFPPDKAGGVSYL